MQHVTQPAVLFRDGTADKNATESVLFCGLQATWAIHDEMTLTRALREADAARARGEHVVFALDYELGGVLEPATQRARVNEGRPNSPLGYIWVFATAERLTREQADC